MGFVNRKLEEDERREYVLDYPMKGKKAKSIGATIDAENDVRILCYANGPIGKREPCDIYSFIFDYKGNVYYVDLRQEICGNDVHWYSACNVSRFNSEQLQSLREAMKVYAYEGFDIWVWNRSIKDPSYITMNDKSNVFVEF
ncbi:MAG: hypothetical protein ACI4E1_14080 [Lachnospira sp.]